ncbi:proline and serine-rich protein 3 [Rana temporaria]|uniref:proline and serine-rich protein 3 n=1 Tax=Rana temporaria TaxID=8407 RepID=UPI001AAD2268|nr:proline and serine-rich protein 3 [Rana temporaria]XP_040183036.1 proline and serine-rich protein 3 [Rana temporaria]
MKSSVAVFSNQGNPFPPPVSGRTHYRPSPPQMLSEEQKQTVLSPVRLPHHLSESLSPPDLHFMAGSQRFVLPDSDSSGPFDESWPSSEGSNKTPEQDRTGSGIYGGSAEPTNEESVIARYMARFRDGRPASRLERSPPQSAMKEFWWLQTSPDSPDVQRFRPGSGISASLGFSPQSLDMTPPLAEGSLNDSKVSPEDVDIIGLQERARKLIVHSESSLSSEGLVSSEGVGSSPSSVSDVSGIRSSSLDRAPVVPFPRAPFTLPVPSVRTHTAVPPEEDILYQWRLRRKMEQAREGTLPLSTRKRSPSPPVRIPKQVFLTAETSEKIVPVPPPETAKSSHPPAHLQPPTACYSHVPLASPHSTSGTVPPHLHLQCDILPCVHSQPPAPCTQRKPERGAVRAAAVPAASPPPAETGHIIQTGRERLPHRRSQKRPEEKKVKSKEEKSKRPADKTGAPPPSPVHQAMDQVISERLFSPLPSPKLKPKKRATAPPAEQKEELQPIEIAAHLLEEAEDSDGTEFGDDPLLQVLREQRQALRFKLREVDLQLAELEGENSENPSRPQRPTSSYH